MEHQRRRKGMERQPRYATRIDSGVAGQREAYGRNRKDWQKVRDEDTEKEPGGFDHARPA